MLYNDTVEYLNIILQVAMDLENIHTYIPFIVGYVVVYLIQHNIFVKPEQLEKVHREILSEVEKKYSTKVDTQNLKDDITDMRGKIDKIYDKLIGGGGN